MTLALLFSLFAATAPAPPPSLPEVVARGFEVVTMDGQKVALANLVGTGQPVLVEFWATWCAPCRKTVPHLVELDRQYRGRGLKVIGLTLEDPVKDRDKVKQFIDKYGITYTIAFAPKEVYQFMNQRDTFTNRSISSAVAGVMQ
jgi:thiol-disulfide isomerase/thioredoxin